MRQLHNDKRTMIYGNVRLKALPSDYLLFMLVDLPAMRNGHEKSKYHCGKLNFAQNFFDIFIKLKDK